jgi:hypothetical protein
MNPYDESKWNGCKRQPGQAARRNGSLANVPLPAKVPDICAPFIFISTVPSKCSSLSEQVNGKPKHNPRWASGRRPRFVTEKDTWPKPNGPAAPNRLLNPTLDASSEEGRLLGVDI